MFSFVLAWFSSVRPVQVVSIAVVMLLLVVQATPITAQASTPPSSCGTPTPAETEGPYFKVGSPVQSNLDGAGQSGTVLHLTGYVTDTSCRPVAGALLDFWQADASGQYDNGGYTFRGHQYTGADGAYALDTVVPGLYPGRTRHIHVKVQGPGGPVLTTQLYFPNETNNSRDGVFQENGQQLLLSVQQAGDGSLSASFNFVVAAPSP